MTRVKRGNIARQSRKKYLNLAKGFIGNNSRLSTFAMEQVIQSFNFSYIGKKLNKRNFRRICLLKFSMILKNQKLIYSKFIGDLKKNSIFLNLKILTMLVNKQPLILQYLLTLI